MEFGGDYLTTTLTILDGADSIGGNKIHLESGDKGLLLDFGTNYKRMGQFYEEYLKPRAIRGVHDYLAMGLVPPIDIYRQDLIPSDFSFRLQHLRVDGVFLTHAHMDHAGCIGLLDPTIPVYASPMTIAILKAYQDSGKSDPPHEVAYFTPRRGDMDARILESQRKAPYQGRRFFCTGAPSERLRWFWRYAAKKDLQQGELTEAKAGPIPFKAFEVDHSIYGATAYAFETDAGWAVYTGDLRMHGALARKTKRFVQEASGLDPKVLVIEGTRIGREKTREESEDDVYENSLSAVRDERGLVVADFSPRHFERLETFSKVAKEVGRRLVVTTRDAYMLKAIGYVDGIDRMRDLAVYRGLKERVDGWERGILEEDFKDRVLDPMDVAKNPEAYILCFSFWDIKNLLDIGTRGGTYIYSGSEAFNEEAEFDFCRLWEWLRLFGLRVFGFRIDESTGKPQFDPGFHASGHASPEELLYMVEEIGPKVVVPVHTENPEFFRENVKNREVLLIKNGDRIKIR
ncbi:MAG: ribonuclease J [Candidatus Hadarchaeales archaeon]